MHRLIIISLVLAFFGNSIQAGFPNLKAKPVRTISALETGRLQNINYLGNENDFDGTWIQRMGVWGFNEYSTSDGQVSVHMGIGGLIWYIFPGDPRQQFTLQKKFMPDLAESYLRYIVTGDLRHPGLEFTLGYFPYKYNPQASNLGEYLFRSSAYPGYLYTSSGFMLTNSSSVRLLGSRIAYTSYDGKFKNEFLVTSEVDLPPLYDFSLSYLTAFKIGEVAELGGGINFHHLIPIDDDITSPKEADDGSGVPHNSYVIAPGDTGYYTFQAIKLMARASVDPGMMMGSDLFQPGDFQLFSEVAVLGVKDYPVFYTDVLRRMPVMFGANLPSFGLFDLLTFQMEYYANPFFNDNEVRLQYTIPVPIEWSDPDDYKVQKRDNWKWSAIVRKNLGNAFSITFQAANDHLRTPTLEGIPSNRSLFSTPKHWYYVTHLEFGF